MLRLRSTFRRKVLIEPSRVPYVPLDGCMALPAKRYEIRQQIRVFPVSVEPIARDDMVNVELPRQGGLRYATSLTGKPVAFTGQRLHGGPVWATVAFFPTEPGRIVGARVTAGFPLPLRLALCGAEVVGLGLALGSFQCVATILAGKLNLAHVIHGPILGHALWRTEKALKRLCPIPGPLDPLTTPGAADGLALEPCGITASDRAILLPRMVSRCLEHLSAVLAWLRHIGSDGLAGTGPRTESHLSVGAWLDGFATGFAGGSSPHALIVSENRRFVK